MTVVIELNDVHFTYGCHPVLDGISLRVDEGEIVGVTGPNGAGKTTLMHLLVGLARPQSGSVKILGLPAGDLKARQQIGFVGQKAAQFNRSYPATAYDVVLSGRAPLRGLFRFFRREDRRLAVEALERVGMLAHRDVPVGELSGGQQQRVVVARALALRPRVLVMDEPTNSLDAGGVKALSEILGRLREEHITMLVVSHDPAWLAGLANKWVCLDRRLCTCNCGHCVDYPRANTVPGCMPYRGEKIGLGCIDSPAGG